MTSRLWPRPLVAASTALAVLLILLTSHSESLAATTDLALAFGEAAGNSGSWTAPSPYTLDVNWDGSTGQRPVAIAHAAVSVSSGTVVTGPTLTNGGAQTTSGGSLLLVGGSSLAVHGTTAATYVHGVTGGSSVAIANPSSMAAGDLAAVYIDTSNTMTAPTGWTLQRTDGDGKVWTKSFATLPSNLGTWSTTGGSGWTYTAIAVGDTCTPIVDGVGGGGTQSSSSVSTGSATAGGATCSGATPTPTPVPPTSTPVPPTSTPTPTPPAASTNTPTPTPVPPTSTPVPPTSTPTSSGPWTTVSDGTSYTVPFGEDRCHNAAQASVDVKADYGAVGDGSHDDGPNFASAIATGKVVHVPSGTYKVSQVNLSADETMVLCGAGQGNTTLIEPASLNATQGMFYQADYSGQGHMTYVEIQNLTLDGNAPNVQRRPQGSSETNYGIVTLMVRKMLVANTEIRNGYHGLRILDVADQAGGVAGEAVIRDNWFHGMALEAGYTGGTTHNIYVAKDWPSNSVVWVARNLIEECGSGTSETCTLPSSTAGQSAGGILYSPDSPNPPQQVWRIMDNTFRNLGMNMQGTDEPEGTIYLYQQADNSQIIHNLIVNSYMEGLAVFSSNNVEIAHNIIEGNGPAVPLSSGYDHEEYYAIGAFSRQTNFPTYVSSSGWNIHDNQVVNSTEYRAGVCICFSADSSGNGTGSNITVANNSFRNNADGLDGGKTLPVDQTNAASPVLWGNDSTRN